MATQTQIFVAHSRAKTGFTVYSYEAHPCANPAAEPIKAGWHKLERDSLEEALADLFDRIRHDWRSLGLPVPPVVDCGRVTAVAGRTFAYGRPGVAGGDGAG